MHVDRSGKPLLSDVLQRYVQDYRSKFNTLLGSVTLNEDVFAPRLHLSEPARVREFGERVYQAQRAINSLPEGGGDLDDSYRPVIREALIWERLAVARRIEAHRTRTVDPELTETINKQLEPLDRLMNQRWLRETPEAIVRQLREYFPLHDIENRREHEEPRA